ncbi:MAG: hypothetical protein NTZ34_00005 [Chloroflexi bacterium]|nr:hypothetical protein [Chloroflexota bacterium]
MTFCPDCRLASADPDLFGAAPSKPDCAVDCPDDDPVSGELDCVVTLPDVTAPEVLLLSTCFLEIQLATEKIKPKTIRQ